MKLQLVTFNNHHKINRCLLCVLWIMAIITCIMYNKFYNLFLWLFFVVGLACLIHNVVYEIYTIIGSCSIDLNSVLLKYKGHLEHIEFSEILFIYGGYKGKDDGFNILNYSNVKSGANNYLIFKKDIATKVQIMLNSKKEYKELLDKLSELEESGIKVEKMRYSVFEFRNIMKKLTLYF